MNTPQQAHWRQAAWQPYVDKTERTDYFISLLPKLPLTTRILEVGCNCGRNLWALQQKGFTNLFGVDINEAALHSGAFPMLKADLRVVDVETEPLPFETGHFGLVFTLAVLEHIYNPQIMDEIVRVSGDYVLGIEDEANETTTHTRRDYSAEFRSRGMEQLSRDYFAAFVFGSGFMAHLFRKET